MERKAYLELLAPQKAREIWHKAIQEQCVPPGTETVDLPDSGGRIVGAPILARQSSPAFHGAAMDGIAVRAEDTFGASLHKPLRLELGARAFEINTGRPLPGGTNAVIMAENVNYDEDGKYAVIEKAAFPWQHVRKTGEDIVETEVILVPGARIGPYELGALAAAGVYKVEVFKKPVIALIPTGTDLVKLEDADASLLRSGEKLPEFNSLVLAAMLREAGAEVVVMPIAPDDPAAIRKEVEDAFAINADIIIINAGTSAGTHDFSADVISGCGEICAHGIAMMPGKPAVLGIMRGKDRSAPVMGAPGYPVSACMAVEEFVLPLLAAWQKRPQPAREKLQVHACNALPSRAGMEERIRVKLGCVDGKVWAVPLPRGAGTVTSLSRADAIIRMPAPLEGINAGEAVEAELLRSREEVEKGLLAIGSHDNALDLVDSFLRSYSPQYRLASAHTGSLGGILALARKQAHFAGSHLLDAETGIYNQSSIRKYLKGVPVVLVRLVEREQGLIVRSGNPLGIRTFKDLTRSGTRFINRQKGSGTRVLLDYELARRGIEPDSIAGYENEEYTHMNVAQAVLSDRADAGLGTRAAACALGLDFVPVGKEEYDLIIPARYMDDDKMLALLDVIRSKAFKEKILSLGGYGVEKTGQIIWEYDGK